MLPKASPDSPPMFSNKLLDLFSRTHPAAVPIIYVPIAMGLFWYGAVHRAVGVPLSLAGFAAGLFIWTFVEYWAHRKFFHWIPNNAFGHRMHFILHGVHHDWPNDRYRLVMPPGASLAALPFFFAAFWLLLREHSYATFSGFIVGYMAYDLLHYYIHHFAPQHPWFKKLRRHHMIHHFKHEAQHRKFGVSSTLWDHVFRTY
ncbi:MAG: sterol desaturase family protein [Myxococcales bacterium]|nr:sterol desaturase family protein [Myxococcales bacterium]